jgi:hypothetical protein
MSWFVRINEAYRSLVTALPIADLAAPGVPPQLAAAAQPCRRSQSTTVLATDTGS